MVADNGTQVYAGNKSSGPRIMNFSGDFKNAFYVRTVSAGKAGYIEYGNTNGYTLPLVYGEYELSCNVAAWKGAPYMKVEVFDPQNAVLLLPSSRQMAMRMARRVLISRVPTRYFSLSIP